MRITSNLVLIAVVCSAGAARAAAENEFRLKPGATGRLCLECHVTFEDTMKLPFVHTPVKSGSCSDCHNPHASTHGKLLAKKTDDLCSDCHAEIVPAQASSVHQIVLEGGCASCHDPHAAPNENNLLVAGNELCASCHADMAAAVSQAAFQHDPVEKNCMVCHDPHASGESDALLRTAVPGLCRDCHDVAQPAFTEQHLGYPVGESRCTSCHDPHGSSARGILWANVHAPIVNKMCGQCHRPASSPEALLTRREGHELCGGCHSDVVNEALAKNRLHWPAVDQRACLNCHGPHATREEALLTKPAPQQCGECHGDTLARLADSSTIHAPVEAGDCVACHSPHAADSVFLLESTGVIELCGTCHDWEEHSSHPLGDKVVDPRNMNLSLDCLSCHRSHGSSFKAFAHYETGSELCVQCHARLRR